MDNSLEKWNPEPPSGEVVTRQLEAGVVDETSAGRSCSPPSMRVIGRSSRRNLK